MKQFRKKYGIVEGVSDREYVSNSFHCHVVEEITPIRKQDLEDVQPGIPMDPGIGQITVHAVYLGKVAAPALRTHIHSASWTRAIYPGSLSPGGIPCTRPIGRI